MHWIDESFRENTAAPDAVVKAVANAVTDYLGALDSEGLADLYEYWCERVEALPKAKPQVGDTYAFRDGAGWSVYRAHMDHPHAGNARVLRHAPQPRQWKIGDLVDDTRDLPDGTIVRDEAENTAEHVAKYDAFTPIGIDALWILDAFDEPHIIWLPENEDQS